MQILPCMQPNSLDVIAYNWRNLSSLPELHPDFIVNYRHAFHAGNFADVHKHVILIAVLDYLLQKPKPILYLDTHAGRGEYDLRSTESLRGNESQDGIGRVLDAQFNSPLLRRYQHIIREIRSSLQSKQLYPGSPLIAHSMLRDMDRRVFVEAHAEECVALRKCMRQQHEHNMTIDDGDGYHALRAYLPPKEKRGVVLIDPPYENADELAQLQQHFIATATRWPTGVYCLWYPLKAGGLVNPFYFALKDSGLTKLLQLELWLRPVDTPLGLNGSGMIIMNPPWQLDEHMRAASNELLSTLAPEGHGGMRVQWLKS